MKIHSRKFITCAVALFCAVGLLAFAQQARAGDDRTYSGNGSTAWGGPIGTATLEISDDTTNINGTLTINEGNTGGNVLVIYIQSGTNGGFTDTSGFNDQADYNRVGISGVGSNGRSVFTFVPGFTPQYALSIDLGNFAGLWGLTNGGNNSLPYITTLNLNPANSTSPGVYTFSFPLSALGLPSGASVVGKSITLGGTFISNTGYRSPECICGNTDGSGGEGTTAETATVSYLIGEVPTTTYPITFQVDMTAMMQAGEFNPGGGDQVQVSGTFNGNTNGLYLSASGNPNIYTVTYQCPDALGTHETFAYTIYPNAGGSIPESTDLRTFVLTNTQTLPVIYFSSYAPSTNATVPLTFSVDMSVQTSGGNFNPASDSVYVYGDLNETAALTWGGSQPMTQSETNTNVYVGVFGDGNYAGTPCQYKFVRYSSALGQYVYESRANRAYNTPASGETFPTVYFNDETNVVVVTFTVDMAAQMVGGKFNPQNGDVVAAAGSYNGGNWGTGTTCTNVPGSSNLFSCSIDIYDAPGTLEQYKFITYGPGISGTDYEQPASTGGNNRTYTLPNGSTNLPTVAFSDQYVSDVLTQPVTVVFSVAMTNQSGPVVGTDSTIWSPGTSVYINGDSIANWATWNTALPQLTEGPNNSAIYTWSNTFAAGTPVIVNYKYSMNGNDDEAGFGVNHVRYIRSYGTYNMPLDVFGGATTEQSFGNLQAGAPSGGKVPITWLGRPGVHLQVASSPKGPWTDHPETDAMSSTNYPMSGNAMYFRLVHPEQ